MTTDANTILLRLAGPMQSWGTASRLQLRRTDAYPSKSGVLGLLLCAMGIPRNDSSTMLQRLSGLVMGVRVDQGGTLDWDYHTAGAKLGIRTAEGKLKRTPATGELETLLSRRQYLFDASFLVGLRGDAEIVQICIDALSAPIWPVYLGRKCCIPTEPILSGFGAFPGMPEALSSVPWQAPLGGSRHSLGSVRTLEAYLEHVDHRPPPANARLVHDVPRAFGYFNYGPRWVVQESLEVPVANSTLQFARNDYRPRRDGGPSQWDAARASRLKLDNHLCVFCKSPAEEVHHVTYANVGHESDADLRSLCSLCHDACTTLEYSHDLRRDRVDPSDPEFRDAIRQQIHRLMTERRAGHRRRLLELGRDTAYRYFDDLPGPAR